MDTIIKLRPFDEKEMLAIDRWALANLDEVGERCGGYKGYDFQAAYGTLYNFAR